MSLVAYGTDSDSDNSEDETPAPATATRAVKTSKDIDDNISDEEDFQAGGGGVGTEDDFFETKEQDLISLISEKLPDAKLKSLKSSFVDESEDVSTIPEKKDYGIQPEEPPAKKKKRDGPVKLVLPALEKLDDEDVDKKPRVEPSKTGSGLFSLLPAPKNSFTRKLHNSVLQSESVSKTPALTAQPNENNLKPQGVRKVGLVPHRVANPVKQPVKTAAKHDDTDDEDDDDYLNVNSNSYFPSSGPSRPATVGPSISINPTPGGFSAPPASLPPQPEMLGPAVAPYPPPAPSYPEPEQHVDNDDAITRLAGKQNKLREMKDDPNMKIVDINEDDMKGDPMVWLTKAMTEEQAPRPSNNGPKGLARSRHQITYLAHQAKERDWELRQEWATSRENRRASANKYGF